MRTSRLVIGRDVLSRFYPRKRRKFTLDFSGLAAADRQQYRSRSGFHPSCSPFGGGNREELGARDLVRLLPARGSFFLFGSSRKCDRIFGHSLLNAGQFTKSRKPSAIDAASPPVS